MKYSDKVCVSALKALAALRETATESERVTIDFIAEAIAEKGERDARQTDVCSDCTGIVYRQTKSGKIIPVAEICPMLEEAHHDH